MSPFHLGTDLIVTGSFLNVELSMYPPSLCIKLNGDTQNDMSMYPPEPMGVTSFGKGVFVDAIK